MDIPYMGSTNVSIGVSDNSSFTNSYTIPVSDENIEIIASMGGSVLSESYSDGHWFWYGFYCGFGWCGFWLILRIVRGIGRQSSEL